MGNFSTVVKPLYSATGTIYVKKSLKKCHDRTIRTNKNTRLWFQNKKCNLTLYDISTRLQILALGKRKQIQSKIVVLLLSVFGSSPYQLKERKFSIGLQHKKGTLVWKNAERWELDISAAVVVF